MLNTSYTCAVVCA